jgi:hypothetical protein
MPKLFPDKNGMLTIEDNKPVTFFVLLGDYSTKGGWIHPKVPDSPRSIHSKLLKDTTAGRGATESEFSR